MHGRGEIGMVHTSGPARAPDGLPVPAAANAGPGQLPIFSRSLPMLLLRAREAVMRHFRAALRRHDITEQQWRVLRALEATGETTVSQLAGATYLLGPSLSRILKDLDARGLIVRRLDAGDMRVGLIRISARGTRLMARVAPRSEAIYAEITARFGAERLGELQALLLALEHALAPAEADGGPDPTHGR